MLFGIGVVGSYVLFGATTAKWAFALGSLSGILLTVYTMGLSHSTRIVQATLEAEAKHHSNMAHQNRETYKAFGQLFSSFKEELRNDRMLNKQTPKALPESGELSHWYESDIIDVSSSEVSV